VFAVLFITFYGIDIRGKKEKDRGEHSPNSLSQRRCWKRENNIYYIHSLKAQEEGKEEEEGTRFLHHHRGELKNVLPSLPSRREKEKKKRKKKWGR